MRELVLTHSNARAVKLLADGFLRPPSEGTRDFVDEDHLVWMSVEGLSEPLQFFHCRVARDGHAAAEYVVVDAGPSETRSTVELVLRSRFPGSTTIFLRSQRTGRAQIECPASVSVEEDCAAAVAVVMCSAAWDESETISVKANVNEYKVAIEFVDGIHRALLAAELRDR